MAKQLWIVFYSRRGWGRSRGRELNYKVVGEGPRAEKQPAARGMERNGRGLKFEELRKMVGRSWGGESLKVELLEGAE